MKQFHLDLSSVFLILHLSQISIICFMLQICDVFFRNIFSSPKNVHLKCVCGLQPRKKLMETQPSIFLENILFFGDSVLSVVEEWTIQTSAKAIICIRDFKSTLIYFPFDLEIKLISFQYSKSFYTSRTFFRKITNKYCNLFLALPLGFNFIRILLSRLLTDMIENIYCSYFR